MPDASIAMPEWTVKPKYLIISVIILLQGGKPTLYQCGPDLGISQELYAWSGSTNPNVDVACRLDFPSEAVLRKFWAQTFADPKYKELLTWVEGAFRMQYFANVCSYPKAGTYWR
jgi:hypothetical protein